jgi:hypothetical protein
MAREPTLNFLNYPRIHSRFLRTLESIEGTYQWQRNGVDMPGAQSDEYRTPVPLNGPTDDGTKYRCVITDTAGHRLVSSEATLTVLPQADPVRLQLTVESGRLVLTWPAEPGLRLQQTPRLRPSDWRDIPSTEGQGRFEIHPAQAAQMFRLGKAP